MSIGLTSHCRTGRSLLRWTALPITAIQRRSTAIIGAISISSSGAGKYTGLTVIRSAPVPTRLSRSPHSWWARHDEDVILSDTSASQHRHERRHNMPGRKKIDTPEGDSPLRKKYNVG